MPRRVTLTDRQREALFHLPVDQGDLLRHYTLSDEDWTCNGFVPVRKCLCHSCFKSEWADTAQI